MPEWVVQEEPDEGDDELADVEIPTDDDADQHLSVIENGGDPVDLESYEMHLAAERAKRGRPPNLHGVAEGSDQKCGTCKHFGNSVCVLYGGYPVRENDVCDSYAPQ